MAVNCRATRALDAELRMLNDDIDLMEEYKLSKRIPHVHDHDGGNPSVCSGSYSGLLSADKYDVRAAVSCLPALILHATRHTRSIR